MPLGERGVDLAYRFSVGALVFLIGWFSWGSLEETVTAGFCAAAQGVFADVEFGAGGHVSVEPARTHRLSEDAAWGARLRFRVPGAVHEESLRISPRRLWYLPCLLFVALVVSLPLGLRERLCGLAVGLVALLAAAIGSVWLTAAWLFARVPGLVYDFSTFQLGLLDFGYETFVTPLGNKLVLPILLAGALFSWGVSRAPARAGRT